MEMHTSGLDLARMNSSHFTTDADIVCAKNFAHPDETREFPLGAVEIIKLGKTTIGRATLRPGWRWSYSLKPIAQTQSCKARHLQYQVSGVLRIQMDDGTEIETRAGDVCSVPPGHDAWVVGNEPVVLIDFEGMSHYGQVS